MNIVAKGKKELQGTLTLLSASRYGREPRAIDAQLFQRAILFFQNPVATVQPRCVQPHLLGKNKKAYPGIYPGPPPIICGNITSPKKESYH